jgi:hypothetical protein
MDIYATIMLEEPFTFLKKYRTGLFMDKLEGRNLKTRWHR